MVRDADSEQSPYTYYFFYVDESGDIGFTLNSAGDLVSSPLYVRGGFILDARSWREFVADFTELYWRYRERIGKAFEIKFSDIKDGRKIFRDVPRDLRYALIGDVVSLFEKYADGAIFIVVKKMAFLKNKHVQEMQTKGAGPSDLLLRYVFDRIGDSFNTWLFKKARATGYGAFGSIIHDEDKMRNDKDLRAVELSKILTGNYHHILRGFVPWDHITERVFFVDSIFSQGVQVADVLCGVVYQHHLGNADFDGFYSKIEKIAKAAGRINIMPTSDRKL